MQDAETLMRQCEEVNTLLRDRLGLRKGPLAARLKRAGRRLPARIQKQGTVITDALALLEHPKLSQQIDFSAVNRALIDVKTHLKSIDPADRRRGAMLGAAGGLAFNLLLFGAILIGVLLWRGFL